MAAPDKVRHAAAWLEQRLQALPAFEVPQDQGHHEFLDVSSYLKPDSEPGGDLQAFLLKNADLAYQAIDLVNSSGEVSEELFLRDVLPFRHFDEPVDNWRPIFFQRLRPLVNDSMDLRRVAETIIPAVFAGALGNPVEFRGNSTPEVMAPLTETLARGYASCTGIAIYLADALRAVGVPARVVGTPEWNISTGGNHNWVEVYWGGQWHFVDGAPASTVEWDRTWFLDNAQKAVPGTKNGIYTPVVDQEEADAKYLITWREPAFEMLAQDRTAFYKHINPNPLVGQDGQEDADWRRYREASEGVR